MKRHKSIIAVGAILTAGLLIIAISGMSQGQDSRVEMTHDITLPEYQSDLGRIISAYERIVDRLMYMTERNFDSIGGGVQQSYEKLSSIESKLTDLAARIARIEKALGIPNTPAGNGLNTGIKSDSNSSGQDQLNP
ncbi:MAG: hypothetical protein BWY69_01057 [Planctomycetes bacterium ADurb.Bin401]|nr:MAG: hypothetical protein BWY69_01057 [Planctomycetes bacterium ADurb.Bin401]